MKVIVINRDEFYNRPQTAWAKISETIKKDIDIPVFINQINEIEAENIQPQLTCSIILPLQLTEYLVEDSKMRISDCYGNLEKVQNDILFLDLKGIKIDQVIAISHVFARTTFTLTKKPTVYILLSNSLFGADIAEYWYKAFYIEPYPLNQLLPYLNQTLSKMRKRAFIRRYFGSRAERIVERVWRFMMRRR